MKSAQIWNFFWSIFSCIWTEYGDLLRKSLYSVRTRETTDHKKLRILNFSRSHFETQSRIYDGASL